MPSFKSNGGFIGANPSYFSTTTYKTPVFVGGVAYSGSGNTTDNQSYSLTSLTGGIGTAPQAGDVVIAAYAETTDNVDLSMSLGTGYTELFEAYDGAGDLNYAVYYKVMGDTPDTTFVNPTGQQASTNGWALAIHVWRNVSKTAPISASGYTVGTSFSLPTVTANYSSSAVIVVAAAGDSGGLDATVISTTGLANEYPALGNDTYDSLIYMGSKFGPVTPGAIPVNAITTDLPIATGDSAGVAVIELAPEAYNSSGIWALNEVAPSFIK